MLLCNIIGMYDDERPTIDQLKREFEALSAKEQTAERDDYAMANIESGRDQGDHYFHRLFSCRNGA